MELIIYIKMDLALNNLQRLICHKTQQTKLNSIDMNLNNKPSNMKNNIFFYCNQIYSEYKHDKSVI